MADPEIDYVVIKEGEETAYDLYRSLSSGAPRLEDIAGLAWKNASGAVRVNPLRQFLDVEKLPFPYQGKAAELLPRYFRPDASYPVAIYQMSRGCYYNCRFCYNDFYHDRKCRRKSPGLVRKELEELVLLGVKNLLFCDDSMGGEKSFLPDLVSVVEGLGLKWSASPRINCIDEGLIDDFERTGCQRLFFGLESPVDRVLKYIGKGITRAEIDRGVEIMRRSKIVSTYSLMVGFPGEEAGEAEAVLDYADELHQLHPEAEIVIQPYAPLPGTGLFEESVEKGFRPPARLVDWSRFTMDRIHTPWLKGKPLFQNVYLISFLAFRYEHILGELDRFLWAYRIAHYLALFRWRRRWFRFYLEGAIYRWYTRRQYRRAGSRVKG